MDAERKYDDPSQAINIDYIVVEPDVARNNAIVQAGSDKYLLSGKGESIANMLRALTIAKCANLPVKIATTGYTDSNGYQYIKTVKL